MFVLHPPDSHANVKAAVAEHVERGKQPGQVNRLVVERAERAGVQPHPAGRRRGDRPQQHRIEVTGHLRRVRLLFARIGAMHINRRDQAIADPQRVVAKVLESAAERAQTSGAADSGPDYGNCETKLHRENPLQADDRRPTLISDIANPFGDPSTIIWAHGAPVRSRLGPAAVRLSRQGPRRGRSRSSPPRGGRGPSRPGPFLPASAPCSSRRRLAGAARGSR